MPKVDLPGHYQCSICREVKPQEDFYKDKGSKSGYGTRCAPCGNQYRKNIIARAPEHYRAKGREYSRKLRLQIVEEYGGRCACCGETEEEFLTVDHIDGGGYIHRKTVSSGTAFYKTLRRDKFPKDKYQLLCRNCNWSKGPGANSVCVHKR